MTATLANVEICHNARTWVVHTPDLPKQAADDLVTSRPIKGKNARAMPVEQPEEWR